jgi:hypothetical protein
MSEEEIVEEFAQLHKSTSRSKTARLRDLYDHIESLRSRGFSHAIIVNAMKKHGLEFDLKTFEVTFYRIKRERSKRLSQPIAMRLEVETSGATQSQWKINKTDGSRSSSSTKTEQKKSFPTKNPLHALSGKPREGDFNHIPKAKFEVDES